MIYLSNTLICC